VADAAGVSFTRVFTAAPADIDELGHVNNAVWVRWVQDMATAHWAAQALPEHIEKYIWVVVRHEIDYRGNLKVGESIEGRTWIDGPPTGAKFDRHVAFVKDGKTLVQAKTTWAIIDKATQRILRVPKDVTARFLPAV
jgi:acyl-CoA thioester hydrolase